MVGIAVGLIGVGLQYKIQYSSRRIDTGSIVMATNL
jgi:hypothetical protein